MSRETDLDNLIGAIAARGANSRSITAIVGPPGAGKSTLAEDIAYALNAREHGSAAIFPMDGFHYDDLVLIPRGLHRRKGAPETFDISGFSHMLGRLRENREHEIAIPVFDRSIEIARAGARIIPQSVRHIICEGNYLLLGTGGWASLHRHYDTTVMISVPETELRQRLSERWKGLLPEDFAFKMEENDLPNGRLVTAESVKPEFILHQI